MLESIINPKRVERGPLKMFFIGLVYASLSLILVRIFFSGDPVLSQYSGMIVVVFCVMFSLPFIYFLIKQEEREDEEVGGLMGVWRVHKDAIFAFMWLFLGFVVAFSFWFMVLQEPVLFNAQIETYCKINSPENLESCVDNYIVGSSESITGAATKELRTLKILENNILVMIMTLIFSLLFGAGAIFILAWNASVISAAISIFTQNNVAEIPVGLGRYMIHGFPEIAAYFVTALAGGMLGVGVLRHGIKNRKFIHILENVAILMIISFVFLIIAAIIEVYLTPLVF